MNAHRIDQLMEYRLIRERGLMHHQKDAFAAGEAVGKTQGYTLAPFRNLLPPPPVGPSGFTQALRILTEQSPVILRPGEIIVGDYYYDTHQILDEPPDNVVRRDGMEALTGNGNGHTTVDINIGFTLGWDGLRQKTLSSLARWKLDGDEDRITYLQAEVEVIDIIAAHILRYADEADRLAQGETDEAQAAEYQEIARIAHKLTKAPPDTFREALQWYWFYVTVERPTSGGMGGCKFDRVFLPYYIKDTANGLTQDEALELISALFLKEGLFYCIGGVNEQGEDETNALSWLAMRAYDRIGGPSNLNVRWHPNMEPAFRDYVVDVAVRHRSGVPSLVNDPVVVDSIVHFGIPLPVARTYAFSGCFWYVVPGLEYTMHDLEAINAVDVLNIVLSRAGEKAITLENLQQLFLDQLDTAMSSLKRELDRMDTTLPQYYPEMVASLQMHGCLEQGRDMCDNAVPYSMTTIMLVGLATAADSLTAIKHIVFEEKQYSLSELCKALKNEKEHASPLLAALAAYPKYGNDDDEADAMALWMADAFKSVVARYQSAKGFCYRPAFYSWNRHIFYGAETGATPDGRPAGFPLSQGVNPSHGRMRKGVTAALNSVTKINFRDTAGAPVHLHLSGKSDERMKSAVRALIDASFAQGLPQIILNFTNRDTLKNAMEHPEEYEDLVVRVTGYSARFVHTSRNLQEEILARNECQL